jgi:hypothetical protein
MLGQIWWGLWALGQALRSLGRERLWVPVLVFLLLQALLLLTLLFFPYWPLSALLVPVLRTMVGEGALHYPFFFLALPVVWTRLALVLDLLLGAFVMGWIYWLAAASDPEVRRRVPTWGRLLRRIGLFALARLPFQILLVVLLLMLPRWVPVGDEGLHGNALRLFRAGILLAAVGVEASFLLVPRALLSSGLRQAWRSALARFRELPLSHYLLVAIPTLLHLPILWALGRTQLVVYYVAPEMVAWILLTGMIVAALTTYLSVVGADRLRRVGVGGTP